MRLLLAQFNAHAPGSLPGLLIALFVIAFIVVIGTILVRLVGGVAEWSDNNQRRVLTVAARVVTKRTAVAAYSRAGGGNGQWAAGSSTSYFATFEFSSGDRKEFGLTATQFGMIAEQDVGDLTFQGTRYQGFNRRNSSLSSVETPAVAEEKTAASAEGFCPYCGAPVRADFRFCPQCSKAQPEHTTKS